MINDTIPAKVPHRFASETLVEHDQSPPPSDQANDNLATGQVITSNNPLAKALIQHDQVAKNKEKTVSETSAIEPFDSVRDAFWAIRSFDEATAHLSGDFVLTSNYTINPYQSDGVNNDSTTTPWSYTNKNGKATYFDEKQILQIQRAIETLKLSYPEELESILGSDGDPYTLTIDDLYQVGNALFDSMLYEEAEQVISSVGSRQEAIQQGFINSRGRLTIAGNLLHNVIERNGDKAGALSKALEDGLLIGSSDSGYVTTDLGILSVDGFEFPEKKGFIKPTESGWELTKEGKEFAAIEQAKWAISDLRSEVWKDDIDPQSTKISSDYRVNPFDSGGNSHANPFNWSFEDDQGNQVFLSERQVLQLQRAFETLENSAQGQKHLEAIFSNPTSNELSFAVTLDVLDKAYNILDDLSESIYFNEVPEETQKPESLRNNLGVNIQSLSDLLFHEDFAEDQKELDLLLYEIFLKALKEADEDGDGYLNPKEMKKFAQLLSGQINHDPNSNTDLEKAFLILIEYIKADKNNDGVLDEEEMKDFLKKIGIPADQLKDMLETLEMSSEDLFAFLENQINALEVNKLLFDFQLILTLLKADSLTEGV